MIIPDHGQHKIVESIVNAFFQDKKTQTFINTYRNCVTIIERESNVNVKLRKVKTYIDLEFHKSGLVNKLTVKSPELVNKYIFTIDGCLESEDYRNIAGPNNKHILGRMSDGLSHRSYDPHGIICAEIYTNPLTGNLHNLKGHARLFKIGRQTVREYYLDGVHIGNDLPVGLDPESFLKNYLLLK